MQASRFLSRRTANPLLCLWQACQRCLCKPSRSCSTWWKLTHSRFELFDVFREEYLSVARHGQHQCSTASSLLRRTKPSHSSAPLMRCLLLLLLHSFQLQPQSSAPNFPFTARSYQGATAPPAAELHQHAPFTARSYRKAGAPAPELRLHIPLHCAKLPEPGPSFLPLGPPCASARSDAVFRCRASAAAGSSTSSVDPCLRSIGNTHWPASHPKQCRFAFDSV